MDKEIIQQSRVLIVDDNQANAALMERLLHQAGYLHFTSIHDSREVISQLRTFKPDLVVLDLMMPHVDGFGVMMQLRGWIPDGTYLPILIVTADISKPAREKALALGAKDFLTKPVDTAEALLRIYNLLQTRWLYQQVKTRNEALIEQVRGAQRHLAAGQVELDRLSASGIPVAQLAQTRNCIAQAVASIERISEATTQAPILGQSAA